MTSIPAGGHERFSALPAAQIADRGCVIVRAKNGGAGDENVRAGFDADARGFGVDAAIDFDVQFAAIPIAPRFRALHFFYHLGPERLTPKTRMHRHDEKEIDGREKRRDCFEGRGGIQGKPDTASGGSNRAQRFRHVMFRFGFDMDGDGIRAGIEEAGEVVIGVLDHEMNIERELRQFAHGGDNGGPEGNVIDEVAIHDVEMEPIGAGRFRAANFVRELGEIRGEEGGSDQRFWCTHGRERRRGNVQRPTSNVQRSIGVAKRDERLPTESERFIKATNSKNAPFIGRWALDVERWMFRRSRPVVSLDATHVRF